MSHYNFKKVTVVPSAKVSFQEIKKSSFLHKHFTIEQLEWRFLIVLRLSWFLGKHDQLKTVFKGFIDFLKAFP